jgi:hypothetical protein
MNPLFTNPWVAKEFYEDEEYRLLRNHVRGHVESLAKLQVKWE